MSGLEQVFDFIKEQSFAFPNLLRWSGGSIENCLNSDLVYEDIKSFSSEISWDESRVLALSQIMLSMIPTVSSPKLLVDKNYDYEGNCDFQVTLEDHVRVLKKCPSSRPKRDPNFKFEPEFRQVKISYIFGIEMNKHSRLFRIRYKLYPQKSWFGYRFDERFRSFDDLVQLIFKELSQYFIDDASDVVVPNDPEDEDIPTSDEDFE